ncbi:MAG: glycosyltransferase [Planctomycetota bacterium]
MTSDDSAPSVVRRDGSPAAKVTVAVIPRERWSASARSLDSVLARTGADVPIVWVDAGTPPDLRRRLTRRFATRPGVTVVQGRGYVAPNRARNLAVERVATPYVAFVDNDVLVAPGWLEALVACAEATSAWAVGPLCQQGPWRSDEVHVAGGDARIEVEDGRRRLVERQAWLGAPAAEVRRTAARARTELAEFHAILVRCSALAAIGGLDEDLPSFGEHTDFCLRVREAGGEVWFEPRAVVTYLPPARLTATDLPFFVARWSPAWNRRSRDRFAARWGLPATDERLAHTMGFAEDHRRSWVRPWSLGRLLSRGPRRTLRRALDGLLSPWLLARARGRGTAGLDPRPLFRGVDPFLGPRGPLAAGSRVFPPPAGPPPAGGGAPLPQSSLPSPTVAG